MSKATRVEVTAEDIAGGCRADTSNCPVARALLRATGEHWNVELSYAWTADPYGRTDLPGRAMRFIERFDNKKPVKPFRFRFPRVRASSDDVK